MSRSTQTWRHSERGAVAGLRLLGIGVLLLAVAATGIYLVNSDKKSSTPTATTTKPPATTAKPPTTTTKPPTTTATSTTLPLETLKCDNQKYALVGTPASPGILPTYLRKTAEKSGKQALIVSPMLCDVPRNDPAVPPAGLIFIGPFDDDVTACQFIDTISQTLSSDSSDAADAANPETGSGDGGSASGTPNEDPTAPDWEVHNIRDLTGEPETC